MNVTCAPSAAAAAALTAPATSGTTTATGTGTGTAEANGFAELLMGELDATTTTPTPTPTPVPAPLVGDVDTDVEAQGITVLAVANPAADSRPAPDGTEEPAETIDPVPPAAVTLAPLPAAVLPQVVLVTPAAATSVVDGSEDHVDTGDQADPTAPLIAADALGAEAAPLVMALDAVPSTVRWAGPTPATAPSSPVADLDVEGPAVDALASVGTLTSTGSGPPGEAEVPVQALPVGSPAPTAGPGQAVTSPAAAPNPGMVLAPVPAATAAPTASLTAEPPVPRDPVTAQVLPVLARAVSHGEGVQRLVLRLHPADLGEVRVTMTVRDGSVDLTLTAGAQARHHLAQGSGELRQMLELVGASAGQIVLRDPVTGVVPSPTSDAFGGPASHGPGLQDADRSGTSGSSDDRSRPDRGGAGHAGGPHERAPASAPRHTTSARSLDLTL